MKSLLALVAAIALVGYGVLIAYGTLTAKVGDDEPLIAAAICVIAGLAALGWVAERHEI